MTTDNLYQAPDAEVLSQEESQVAPFYVVSKQKFTLLFFITCGTYMLYWFYENWRRVKMHENLSVWPIPRAIFSIFFTHSLFAKMSHAYESRGNVEWNATSMASLYVVLSIASSVLDRLSYKEIGSPSTDILSLLMLIPLWLVLSSAQKVANIIGNDEKGASNDQLTAINWIFIILGCAFWLLILVGLLFYFGIDLFAV